MVVTEDWDELAFIQWVETDQFICSTRVDAFSSQDESLEFMKILAEDLVKGDVQISEVKLEKNKRLKKLGLPTVLPSKKKYKVAGQSSEEAAKSILDGVAQAKAKALAEQGKGDAKHKMPQEKTQSSGTTKKPAKATPAGGYTSSDSDVMGSSDNSSSSDSEASHVSQVEDQVAPPVADDDTQGGKDSKRRRMSSKGPVEKFDQVGKNKNEQEINVAVPKAKGSAKGKTSGRRKKVTAPTGADEHEKPKEGTMVTSVDATDVVGEQIHENETDCEFSEVELPSPTIEENLVRSSVPSCLKYRHRRLSLSAVPMLLCLTLFACANGSFSSPYQLELTPSFAFSVEGRVAGMSAGGGGGAVLRREVSTDSYYSSYSSARSAHGRSPVRRERSRSRSASTTVDMDDPGSKRNKEIMEKHEKNMNKHQTNPEEAMKAALDAKIGMHVWEKPRCQKSDGCRDVCIDGGNTSDGPSVE